MAMQIRRQWSVNISLSVFLISFFFKLLSGILLGWIYFYHYKTGDTILFFEKSVYLSQIFKVDAPHFLKIVFLNIYDADFITSMGNVASNIPRTVFFVKILSLLNLLTNNNYWVGSLYLSLFCFAGSWRLVSVLHRLYPNKLIPIVIAFLVFPSVVFWSSGVLKESIFMGSLYFTLSFMLEFLNDRSSINIFKITFLILNLWLLFCLKYFLFAIFISSFGSYALAFLIIPKNVKTGWKLLCHLLIFGVFILASTQIHYALSFQYFIHEVITYHDEIFVYTINEIGKEHSSLVHFGSLTENIPSLISKIPMAVFTGLFMPLPVHFYNAFQMITAVENILLMVFTIWSITIFIQRPKFNLLKITMVVYVLICAGIFAFTSPNLGTLARYKVAYLPFLLLLITSNTLKWDSNEQRISEE